mmetsp:Transcript_19423/g.31968  ORF Transcript_19423/g.31968 Transcript_19423/m.31968 type:complete len:782 (+) Transcript_19423:254-2599(+)
MSQKWKCMREHTKEVLLRDVLKSVNKSKAAIPMYRVLVIDHRATRVVSSCLRMHDITEEGIALVESLEKRRQPFPELEAVYMVEPSKASVSKICEDFSDPTNPRYGKVHIFFLTHCSDDIFGLIKACPNLISRVATLTEVNLDYLAVEENVFHLDMDAAMVQFYNARGTGRGTCTKSVVEKLVTFCASLNEYPFVRYEAKSELSTLLANEFQNSFNTFVNQNKTFWWRGDGGEGHGDLSSRATLVVLDRSQDPSVPLMHNFSYQAMIHDCLNIQDDLCRYYKGDVDRYNGQDEDPKLLLEPVPDKNSDIGVCLLNEDDPLWVEFRHLHITKVIEKLNSHLQRYMETSIGKLNRKNGDGSAASLEEMNKAIQELPEYQEMMEKHAQHLQLTRLCMTKLQKHRLLDCARLEQNMITGVNHEGVQVTASTLANELMGLIRDPAVDSQGSARLVAMYIITRRSGVKEEDLKHIIESAHPPLSDEQITSLNDLVYLGVQVKAEPGSKAKSISKSKLAENKRIAESSPDQYNRYTPEIAAVIQKLCKRKLNTNDYPYVIEPPPMLPEELPSFHADNGSSTAASGFGASFAAAFGKQAAPVKQQETPPVNPDGVVLSVRKKPTSKAAAAKKTSPKNNGVSTPAIKPEKAQLRNPKGSRIIVFIAGGATYAELGALHKVMSESNRDIIIGTTHMLPPKLYLNDLQYLNSSRTAGFYQAKEEWAALKRAAVQKRVQKEAGAAGAAAAEPAPAESAAAVARAASSGKEIKPPTKKKKKGGLFSCGCMGGQP